jgi:hypothetical protein
MVTINRKLNLVIELWRENAPSLYAHSTALPAEIVEQYFDLCGPTMNTLLVGGYGYTAPRYASLVFKQVAMRLIGPEPVDDKEGYRRLKMATEARIKAFYDELHRLTSILALKDGRWGPVPIDEAVALGAITAEELSHVDASLVFFTCGSQSVPARSRETMLGGLSLFDARLESLNCTDFVHFLQTSMKDDSTGAKQDASPPFSTGLQEKDSPSSSKTSTRPSSHTGRPAGTGFAITSISRPVSEH